jgi:hypothetical protein
MCGLVIFDRIDDDDDTFHGSCTFIGNVEFRQQNKPHFVVVRD